MDAGRSDGDVDARNAQIAQLTASIARVAPDDAIIVAGDTTMRESDEVSVQDLLRGNNLKDACRVASCSEPARQNRVMFRDGAKVKLTVEEWRAESTFVNAQGEQLSDQLPVRATFRWRSN